MLKSTEHAPTFIVKDILDREISLSQSGKFTYLSFHRFAACPFCNLRTRELIKKYPLFEQHNIEIISIWPSKKSNMLKYIGKENAPFPLIADEKKELFKKYHVVKSSSSSILKLLLHPEILFKAMKGIYKNIEVDADPTLLPAEFLISPTGEIVFAYYGKHFGDHVDVEQLLNITSKLNQS